jgi:endoglucanase
MLGCSLAAQSILKRENTKCLLKAKVMKIKFAITFLILFIGISLSLTGQSFLSTQGKAIVKENGDTILLRGMGLGGWMLQEGYMLKTASFANAQYQIKAKIAELIGEEDTELFYDAWLSNHVTKADIDSLATWGFNSVRLPMHYNLYTLPIEDEPVSGENTWLDRGFVMTDSLIAWCAANEMYVILDLHAAPGGQGYDQGISDYDPTKPSLWESFENQEKTASLWKKLAERYVDEPWVAGYDLLNEPNWNLPGGVALRNLYERITDSIRTVDNNHMLIIEGNWFANDFTGLTPPWDDNMVYSPHKYWSFNDQASIQWVLDLRNQYDIPLYFGETGENSNTWFRDAAKLFEDNGIGWAWWPMKKIQDIAGPTSVILTPEYQTLLNYWNNGGAPPSAAFAKTTLMEMAENLKLQNCIIQKDVYDALIRQTYSDEAIPFNTFEIPGVVYATDFDLGRRGVAYHDTDVANYHLSTGNFTAWNKGWAYRNDGVDIEPCNDNVNTNGYNVGWTEPGEWMQYDVDVQESGVYDINLRLASGAFDGSFHFSLDGADITNLRYAPYTGGYQTWQTVTVPNVVLATDNKKLRFHSDGSGYNINSFEFVKTGEISSIDADFVSAFTLDQHTVQLNLNKPMAGPLPSAPADFEIQVNGNLVDISAVSLSDDNPRIVLLEVDYTFQHHHTIKITYDGDEIQAVDETVLIGFNQRDVENRIPQVHNVPGLVEAEGFFFNSGAELENTFDIGGGKNIGHLDVGDYLDYYIDVAFDDTYQIDYRTAAQSETGEVQLQVVRENGSIEVLQTTSFPPTGDWQSWATTSASQFVVLEEGRHHIRLAITQPSFNLNWFEFTGLTPVVNPDLVRKMSVSPNPGTGIFRFSATFTESLDAFVAVMDTNGKQLKQYQFKNISEINEVIDLSEFPNGNYFFSMHSPEGVLYSEVLIKVDNP